MNSGSSIETRIKESTKNLFTKLPFSLVAESFRGLGACLLYHRVLPNGNTPSALPSNPYLEVTESNFEAQMEIVSTGNPVAVPKMIELLKKGKLPHGSIAVTFDDGYRDNLTSALPILEKFGIPATIYIAPALIDGSVSAWWYKNDNENKSLFLNWDELKCLSKHPLITIGAHTVNHAVLSELTCDQLKYELSECKSILEKRLGVEVQHLAYPYGSALHAGRREFEAANEVYHSAFTTRNGHLHLRHRRHLTALPRITVQLNDSIKIFKRKLSGVDAMFASRGRRVVTD